MSDELERLNRVLDRMAAERPKSEDLHLDAETSRLAQTAAFLKGANLERSIPDEAFVERLAGRLNDLQRPQVPPTPLHQGEADDALAVPASSTPPGLSRRHLIGRLAAAAAGIAAGTGAGEAIRGRTDEVAAASAYERGRREGALRAEAAPYQAVLVPEDRGRWFDTGHSIKDLAPGRVLPFRAGAIAGHLVDPGDGGPIHALSAACTHMGCQVAWRAASADFLCPCHGARYGTEGNVRSGIARHPLPRLRLKVDERGAIAVWSVTDDPPVTTLSHYDEP